MEDLPDYFLARKSASLKALLVVWQPHNHFHGLVSVQIKPE